ncbi:hypothetical protein ACLKA6_011936 [Drosophila palustris]
MHAGAHATCAYVRQRFWVINARQLARKTVRSCIACFRQRPVLANQIMGSLPASRVQQGLHPFERAGMDYAGPLWMHFNQRGRRPPRCTWKNVLGHLEAINDGLEIMLALTRSMFSAQLECNVTEDRKGSCGQSGYNRACSEFRKRVDLPQNELIAVPNSEIRQKLSFSKRVL